MYSEQNFVRRFQILSTTFKFIVGLVGPEMKKYAWGGGIKVWDRIAVASNRLGTWNYLTMCGDLYDICERLASIIVREICAILVRIGIPLFVHKSTASSIKEVASRFEKIHGITNITGAIECSHIAIIAPPQDKEVYYNRKVLYSWLL